MYAKRIANDSAVVLADANTRALSIPHPADCVAALDLTHPSYRIVLPLCRVVDCAAGGQFIYYILCFMILVYYTAQIVVLFTENALRDVALVNLAFKSVHLITGMVIMLPVLLLSFIPLFVDLQTRMLFNEDFSQRYVFFSLVCLVICLVICLSVCCYFCTRT